MTKKKILIGAAVVVGVYAYFYYMKSKKAAVVNAEPASEEAKAAVSDAAENVAPILPRTKKPLILNKFNRVSLKGGKFGMPMKAVSVPKTTNPVIYL